MDTIIPQKQCTDCLKFKPATSEYFPVSSAAKSGLRSQCKQCRSAQRKVHRTENIEAYHAYEQARIEKHRQDCQKYRETHRDKHRRAGREYVKAHAEKLRAYVVAHPEQIKATKRKYDRNHPDEKRVRKHKRRALINGSSGTHSHADIRKQYAYQKGKCYYCSASVGTTYHVDHVIPLVKGGSNGPENLVIACPTCNLKKKDKVIRLL